VIGKPPCRRCLLEDMPDQAELAKNLRELIDLIPEENRTGGAEYRKRLEICRDCGHLRRATCELCGCYVEHRAAKKKAGCPAEKW